MRPCIESLTILFCPWHSAVKIINQGTRSLYEIYPVKELPHRSHPEVFSEKGVLKDTHREKEPPNKTLAFTKSTNMDIWVVGTSNQIIVRGS